MIYNYGIAVQESQNFDDAKLFPWIGRAKADRCVLNPFQYNAGNVDTWSSADLMQFNFHFHFDFNYGQRYLVDNHAGQFNYECNLQYNSGNFHYMSFVAASTMAQFVQWVTLRRDDLPGMCKSLQQQMVDGTAEFCAVTSNYGGMADEQTYGDRDGFLRGDMVGTLESEFSFNVSFSADGGSNMNMWQLLVQQFSTWCTD